MGLVGAGLALMPACGPTPIEPAPTAAVPGTPNGGGEPMQPPEAPHLSPLIGTWRGVIATFLPNTVQTTTWRFDPDDACLETFLTITDGIENASDRPCTWTATSSTVTVTSAGVGGAVTFTMQYSFPSPDVLRLDADEFGRVS